MHQPRGTMTDTLLAGDEGERARWRLGLALAAACVLVAMVGRVAFFLLSAPGVSELVAGTYIGLGAINSVLWISAVWLVMPPSVVEKRRWMRRPWIAARVLCFAWLVGYGCLVARYATNPSGLVETALGIGDLGGRALGGIGVLCVAFVLSFLAGEAEMERAERRLNAAVWLLAFPTLLAQAFPEKMAWFTLIPLGMVLFFWCWLMGLLLLGILDLHRHVRWGQREAIVTVDRQRRIDERRADLDAEIAATVRPVPRHGGDITLD